MQEFKDAYAWKSCRYSKRFLGVTRKGGMHIGPRTDTRSKSLRKREKELGMKRLFERVFVRPPSEDYPNCNSTNPDKEGIDLVLAKNQHREYISILKESAIDVVELPVLNGHPD